MKSDDSVIDLVFWNSTLFDDVFDGLEISWSDNLMSDHAFISWAIDLDPAEVDEVEGPTSYIINDAKSEEWTKECHAYLAEHPLSALDTPEKIETFANHAREACQRATAATMKARVPCRSERSKPWWCDTCDDAVILLRTSPEAEKPNRVNYLKRLTKRTKSSFFNAKLKGAKPEDIPRMIKWSQGKRAKKTPPISGAVGTASTPKEKARAFAMAFFPSNSPPAADLNDHELTSHDPRVHVPLVYDELEDALRGCSNTSAPGISEIGYRLIKWGGVELLSYLQAIYNACLSLGYHPRSWRAALIAIVAKPRKPDLSNPRSYRPIALLECFSKLLEKIQATRIQFEIGKFKLLGTNQFGCRAKSSCVDAGLTLIHDVHTAWAKNQVASALMFDIKGFFDNIQHGRLLQILRRLGFNPNLCRWIESFLSERIVRIKVDGTVTDPIQLRDIGVPQGSPLSPILAAIYTSPTLNMCHERPGTSLAYYVDDALILAVSSSLEENCAALADAHAAVAGSLLSAGLPTDPQKNELIHFVRKWPERPPRVLIQGADGQPLLVFPAKVVRWLGFYLDHKLCFKDHIQRMANAAMSVVKMLNILGNSIGGASMLNRRLAYKSVVLPVLTYGAPLWYHKCTPLSYIKQLDKVQNAALRLMTGCFRTTSGRAMRHIGAILPIRRYLQKLHDGAAIRLRTLASDAQPITRLSLLWRPAQYPKPVSPPRADTKRMSTLKQRSPLMRLATSSGLQKATDERTVPFVSPPWEPKNKWGHRLLISGTPPAKGNDGKLLRAKEIQELMERSRADPSMLMCFTDGSRHSRNRRSKKQTGAAYSILHGGNEIAKGSFGLGKRSNVYDAELCALTAVAGRLRSVTSDNPDINRVFIFADSSSAIGAILDAKPHPGQQFSLLFRSHIDQIFSSAQGDLRVEVKWTPGHAGVFGNELVDRRAKEAITLQPVAGGTIAYARERASRKPLKQWRKAWLAHPKTSWSDVGLSMPPTKRPNEIWADCGSDRGLSSRLAQVLTGHGHYGDYYRRFVPTERTDCPCGAQRQTREHILWECPIHAHARHHLETAVPSLSLPILLGTPEGRRALVAFLKDSSAFQKLAPEHAHRNLADPLDPHRQDRGVEPPRGPVLNCEL
jgi:ribonuclease HI